MWSKNCYESNGTSGYIYIAFSHLQLLREKRKHLVVTRVRVIFLSQREEGSLRSVIQ